MKKLGTIRFRLLSHYRCDSRDTGGEIGLWRRDRINGCCDYSVRC